MKMQNSQKAQQERYQDANFGTTFKTKTSKILLLALKTKVNKRRVMTASIMTEFIP